nr:substrate-binding domain-containing protein [Maliibacterium massiliense]
MSKKTAKILTLVVTIMVAASLLMACTPKVESVAPSISQQVVTADDEKQDANDVNLSEKKRTFGLSIKTLTNPFFVNVKDAIEDNLKEGDTLVVTDANNDANKQMTDMEDLVTSGHDVIFCSPVDYRGIKPALENAHSKGIPVVLVDSLAFDMNLVAGSSVSDNVQAGRLAAEALAKDIKEEGKICIFENTTSPAVRERVQGFEEVIKNFPNIEIAARENGKGQIDTALPVMENFMQAVPDMKAVFSMNDPSAEGCIAAVEAAGKTGDILVYGIDGSDKGKQLVKDGKQAGTAAQFPLKMGEQAAVQAYKILADLESGKSLDEIITAGTYNVKIPCEWIDASNVDQYITQK